jgi:hypothetical protein
MIWGLPFRNEAGWCPGTQEGLLHWILLRPPAPPAPRLSTTPSVAVGEVEATMAQWSQQAELSRAQWQRWWRRRPPRMCEQEGAEWGERVRVCRASRDARRLSLAQPGHVTDQPRRWFCSSTVGHDRPVQIRHQALMEPTNSACSSPYNS